MNNTTNPQIQPDYFYIRRKVNGEIDPNHGVTVAYHLAVKDETLYLVAGLAVCNELDNFSKKIGRQIATSRLKSFMLGEDVVWAFEIPLQPMKKIPETAVSYIENTNLVRIQENQYPLFSRLVNIVKNEVIDIRLSEYVFYDAAVREEIESMFDDIEDDECDDEYEDEGDDEYEDEDDDEGDDEGDDEDDDK